MVTIYVICVSLIFKSSPFQLFLAFWILLIWESVSIKAHLKSLIKDCMCINYHTTVCLKNFIGYFVKLLMIQILRANWTWGTFAHTNFNQLQLTWALTLSPVLPYLDRIEHLAFDTLPRSIKITVLSGPINKLWGCETRTYKITKLEQWTFICLN